MAQRKLETNRLVTGHTTPSYNTLCGDSQLGRNPGNSGFYLALATYNFFLGGNLSRGYLCLTYKVL